MEKLGNFLQDCRNFTVICFILVSLAMPAVLLAGAAVIMFWDVVIAQIPHAGQISLCTFAAAAVFAVIDYFIIRRLVKADEEKRATED